MKEAAGEANMTIITIILIGIVLVIGTIIINGVMTTTQKQSCCTANGGTWVKGACTPAGTPTDNCKGEVSQ